MHCYRFGTNYRYISTCKLSDEAVGPNVTSMSQIRCCWNDHQASVSVLM